MTRAIRDGRRKTRASFPQKKPDLGYYYIVTDTQATEKLYLEGLRNTLPKSLQGRLVITVSQSSTDKLVTTCKDGYALHPQFCEPWIVFDRDRVVNFDQIIKQACEENIHVGWSNPCIEIWFDAYFGIMHSYMDSRSCYSNFFHTFKQRTGQDYKKSNDSNYNILNRFGDEEKAIQIAENRLRSHDSTNLPSQKCPGTTIHRLINEIRKKQHNE